MTKWMIARWTFLSQSRPGRIHVVDPNLQRGAGSQLIFFPKCSSSLAMTPGSNSLQTGHPAEPCGLACSLCAQCLLCKAAPDQKAKVGQIQRGCSKARHMCHHGCPHGHPRCLKSLRNKGSNQGGCPRQLRIFHQFIRNQCTLFNII